MFESDKIGPSYYKRGSIQVWDFVRDQGLNFHLGNAIKYICRAGHKDSKIQDLEKAIHYLQNELDHARRDQQVRIDDYVLALGTGTDLSDSDGSTDWHQAG